MTSGVDPATPGADGAGESDVVTVEPETVPSQLDPTAWRTSWSVGGPWGSHAGVSSWWTPLRWVLVLTMLSLLVGFGGKATCASGDRSAAGVASHMCGSDIVPLWSSAHLDSGAVPYRDASLPYPVLTGGVVMVAAELAHGLHALDHNWRLVLLFGIAADLLLTLCALAVAGCTALTVRRRPYDAAIVALSPLLALHAFTAWDLVAMAAASGALLAWSRRRPVLAGALIGLGTAAKLYPALLLVALAMLAFRTRRVADAAWAALTALLVWLAVNGPVAISYHSAWTQFFHHAADAGADRWSLWSIVHTMSTGSLSDTDATPWAPSNVAVVLAVVAGLLGVSWAVLRAPMRPRLGQVAFLCVLAYLLTSSHWAPSQSLWLLPLLALARPRWRLSVIWQFSEVFVWFMTGFVQLGVISGRTGHGFGVSYGWLVVAVLLRDVLLLALGALVVQEMWHPELDVVRLHGDDDPAGGVFDGAPDYWDTEAPSADLR